MAELSSKKRKGEKASKPVMQYREHLRMMEDTKQGTVNIIKMDIEGGLKNPIKDLAESKQSSLSRENQESDQKTIRHNPKSANSNMLIHSELGAT